MKQNVKATVAEQFANRSDAVENYEGGLAFTLEPCSKLYTRVCSSLAGEDKFYTNGKTVDSELLTDIQEAAKVNPEFILRLAAYARQKMNIRSTPIVLLAEAAALPACKPFVRRWAPEIIRRADEPAEVIAYWVKRHGPIGSHGTAGGEHAFPNSLSRGIGDVLERFDEYQFAKYDRNNCAISLRDVLRIVRPTPKTAECSALYRYLVSGQVDSQLLPKLAAKAELMRKQEFNAEARELITKAHATWEVVISKFGSRAEVWNEINLSFMAGLRNLRNLLEKNADQALAQVIAMLRDAEHVKRSRQLPSRFYSAYRAITPYESGRCMCYEQQTEESDKVANHPMVNAAREAILQALASSVVNLPRLSGRTFITADNSGSMQTPISAKSTVCRRDIANLLAAIAHTMCDEAICSVFGTHHKVVPVVREDSILTNMDRLANTDVDHSTNAYLAVKHLRETRTRVDRIILFSDMQCYDLEARNNGYWCESGQSLTEELHKYRSTVNPQVHLYSVDLAGYGTAQFPQSDRRVALLAGWSERLLEFIPLFEQDKVQAVEQIAKWMPSAKNRASRETA
ncbi:MAG: TROVE domain-containing protein [Patescibacteria group bacterium]|nr:TROVE domain-containing protein [Patescibacteria group bacterium]MDD5490868.1 TROVE domain-containing protein [Patescibacteria group bacterium]